MGKTAILSVRIISDAKKAIDGLNKTERRLDGLASFAAKLGLGAALTKGLTDGISADAARRKLAAGLNLSKADAETAGKIAGKVYGKGLGENMDDVNGAIDAVASSLADVSKNGGADVQRLTEKALTLSSVFGTDVSEATQTASIMMKNGLAKDADGAMDSIAAAMQKVPKAVRGEVIPTLDEYSKHFAGVGLDGDAALALIVEGSKNGAIGMDKMGDAVKEFGIRASDMSTTSKVAFDAIGLNQQAMADKIAAGGDDAKDAFLKIVTGLQGVEDPAEKANAAIALFGTPLEDLGVDQIPAFLDSLMKANQGIGDTTGTLEKMGATITEGPQASLDRFTRGAMLSLQTTMAEAIPFIQPVLDLLVQFAPILGPLTVVIAGVTAAVWAVNAAQRAWTTAQLVGTGVTKGITSAQKSWNLALRANPIGLVITLVAGLIAVVVTAYNKVGWFKAGVDAMGRVAVRVWNTLVGWVQKAIGWLDNTLAPIGGIKGAFNIMKASVKVVWDSVVGFIKKGIDWIDKVLEPIGGIKGAFETFGDAAKAAWDGVTGAIDGVVGAIKKVKGWIDSAVGWFGKLFHRANDAKGAAEGARSASAQSKMVAPAPLPVAGLSMMRTFTVPTMGASASTPLASAVAALVPGGAFEAPRGGSSGREVNINVTVNAGVGDPVAIGREVETVLKKYRRHVGADA